MYESLEERPTMLSSIARSSSSSSLSSLTTPTLQQAAAKQNLASNSMNIANLMNLGNLSSSVGRASGLNPGSLAGSHHQLGGPGLVQGGHYIAQ
ncbi:hypothetical protein F8M41_017366 [Gigaspora margarita]|uniref:Uncharacterized protein n=1 Tax=Gigaspora margarita TaxID=4874 RepID=A0A8H4AN30_GIGMA|nr:hypothetical protein F8M41_017366 [Gigaspora margarita]